MKRIMQGSILIIMFVASTAFATTIDLTFDSISNPIHEGIVAGDGSIWRVVENQPTGTGYIEPFLRLEESINKGKFKNPNGVEVGLNTDAKNPGVANDKASIWTHSLKWGELAMVTVGSTTYYQFTFDINEPPGNDIQKYISLDTLRLYSGTIPDATFGDPGEYGSDPVGLALLYNFGTSPAEGPPVLIDYTLSSSGSGRDDIEVLIPTFDVGPDLYMYLYVQFGEVGTQGQGKDRKEFQAQDGFEEVRALLGAPHKIPEPISLILLGSGLAGAGLYRRLKKINS